MDKLLSQYKIAVLIPVRNERLTISSVVNDIKTELRSFDTSVYVYDNMSNDGTQQQIANLDVTSKQVRPLGKGAVIRQMFKDVDADLYILIDGDDTYDVSNLKQHVSLALSNNINMYIGARHYLKPFSVLHRVSNCIVNLFLYLLFHIQTVDNLSGYRILSRSFVKSFKSRFDGFEIEAELSVFAKTEHFCMKNFYCEYKPRVKNSHSKIRLFRDGYLILKSIFVLFMAKKGAGWNEN